MLDGCKAGHEERMLRVGAPDSIRLADEPRFPYIDTLKILQKFGPGCIFYGHGSEDELQELEACLKSGERILALFCEFPGNPLLKSPDLAMIRRLADGYDFAVVVDDTIGNFLNVNVLQYADIAVSSLTKMFSGSSNVMGGSAVLNPHGKYYRLLKKTWTTHYEDNYWAEDALFMERNSRDFISRAERVNTNADAICSVLRAHPRGATDPDASAPLTAPSQSSVLPKVQRHENPLRQLPKRERRLRWSRFDDLPQQGRRDTLLRRSRDGKGPESRHKLHAEVRLTRENPASLTCPAARTCCWRTFSN
jgi:Cys/Met metabolism PLP-dependent enzyme